MRTVAQVLAAALALAFAQNEPGELRYYMYTQPELDFSHLLACPGVAQLVNSTHGEGLQEIHVWERLSKPQPWRVATPQEANVFYVPVMEYLSWKVGTCNGASHATRMIQAYTTLRKLPSFRRRAGRDHFWVSSKSHAYGPDLVGTQFANLNASISMRMRMKPLSKALRRSIVGRMKPFGRVHPKAVSSAVGSCTFDVGHQPNQEALRIFKAADPLHPRERLVYFAGSFDVCCTGKLIRCRLANLLPMTDGDADTLLVPSRGARGIGRDCTEKALISVAAKRGVHVEQVAAEYRRLADGPSGNRYVQMAHYMANSVFCLAPAGDTCTSSRFYSALAAGCIPVVLCDGLKAAFHDLVEYRSFTLSYDTTVLMDNPMSLMDALRAVPADEIRRMQRALVENRDRVLFQVGDGQRVVANLLSEVAMCLHRSRAPAYKPDGASDKPSEYDDASTADAQPSTEAHSSAEHTLEELRAAVQRLEEQQAVMLNTIGRLAGRAGGGRGSERDGHRALARQDQPCALALSAPERAVWPATAR
ncbi:hypothetical protein KFE25_002894 [Diacronema lutheri]|uniref:Exostosin GT47 domain-containing protein n=1 Tax=Diacronema lutheri TaxID=2081491 RepID=A0A8J5XP60_DIALT|nr:hypothetical protein KFE25_002894 [Diacronema lutheri]